MSKTIYQLGAASSLNLTDKIEVSQSDAPSSESVYGTMQQVINNIVNVNAQLPSSTKVTGLDAQLNAKLNLAGGTMTGNLNFSSGSLNLGTVDDEPSAILQMVSSTQGFLPPGLDVSQRDSISSPAPGLNIYNKTYDTIDYFDGASWQNVLAIDKCIAGSNMNIVDNGDGTVTFSSAGGGSIIAAAQASFVVNGNTAPVIFPGASDQYVVVDPGSFSAIRQLNTSAVLFNGNVPGIKSLNVGTHWYYVNFDLSLKSNATALEQYSFVLCIQQNGGPFVTTTYRVQVAANSSTAEPSLTISGLLQLNENDVAMLQVKNSTSPYNTIIVTGMCCSAFDLTISGLANSDELIEGTQNIWLSQDGGTTYQNISDPLTVGNLVEASTVGGQLMDSGVSASDIVLIPGAQTITGIKTFSSSIIGNLTGNADTATIAATASAANTVSTTQSTTNATFYPIFVSSSTNGYQSSRLGLGLTFNPNTNVLDATGLKLSGLTASLGVFTDSTSNLTSTGTLPFSQGGFGFSTATTGDIFYASATNTPAKLADVATGQVLVSGGVGIAPAYSASPSLSSLTLTTAAAGALTFSGTAISGTNAVIQFSNTLSDGTHLNFGLSGRSMAVLSNGALAMTYGLNYSASANGYLYAFTGVPGCAIEVSNTNGFLKYVGSGTVNNTATLSTALDWDTTTGIVSIPVKLGIGASQTQAITTALSLRGANNSVDNALNFFVAGDQYPITQFYAYTHNNASLSFDGYYDGSGWRSGFNSSSFQISKFQNRLDINYGVATAGATVAWSTALSISSTGNVSFPQAGKTLTYKTGSNAAVFSGAVMVAGTVTVNTTAVATGDIVKIMKTANGGTSTTGLPAVTIVNATSITLTGDVTDTSTWSGSFIHTN